MRNITKLISISLVALMLCSVAARSASAAVFSYDLVVEKAAYAKYECVFGNSTDPPFVTGSTFTYLVAEINMSWGYTISDLINTYNIEGALFALYFNDTFFDLIPTSAMGYPMVFLLTPTSDEWWTTFKTWVESQSVYNKVTIATDVVAVTWFTTNGVNDTFTGTLDKDTGVVLSFKDVKINLGTNITYVFDMRLLETNIPNVPGSNVPQPTSPLLVAAMVGGSVVVGLGAGILIGRKRVA